MKRSTIIATAVMALLSAPAFAQSSGPVEDWGGPSRSQIGQIIGTAQFAASTETKKATSTKSRKRMMNTMSGNCWDAQNPACQNYRPPQPVQPSQPSRTPRR